MNNKHEWPDRDLKAEEEFYPVIDAELRKFIPTFIPEDDDSWKNATAYLADLYLDVGYEVRQRLDYLFPSHHESTTTEEMKHGIRTR